MAEPAWPITDHRLAFSMAEPARTDGLTDERTHERVFFRKEESLEPLLPLVFCFALGYQIEAWVCSGFLLCAWVPNRTLGLLWKRRGGEGDEGRKRREVSWVLFFSRAP